MTVPAQLVCNHCRKPMRGYFKIERFNASGASTITTSLCSALCVASWAQNYIVMAGRMGVAQASNVISGLIEAIRGPRG